MDSKLRAQVIAFVSVLVLLVVGSVYLLNEYERQKEKSASQVAQSQQSQEETSKLNQDLTTDIDLYSRYDLNPHKDPYAFLSDDKFFDGPKEEEDDRDALGLLVTTAQKDIRILLVDKEGELREDIPFSVKLSKDGKPVALKDAMEQGVYADNDHDGRIFLEEVPAGDYEIALLPMEEYKVPKKPSKVEVSEELSYTVLKDVSFLIMDESQIDAAKEDTAVNEAEMDADGTETNVRLADGASVFGIDVSKWNKDIDWKKVKDAGVEFAIIRVGYRGSKSGYLVQDPYFEKNIKEATEAGVRVGVYFFTQAITPAEAVEEASMVLMLCKEYKIAYPMFIDTEGAGGAGRADGLSKEIRTAVCKAFCETIDNAGFNGGVYASKSWLNNNLDMSQLSEYSIWLAQYSKQATYEGDYGMWQYTSAGTLDGISTLVDFNVSFMDY